MIMNLQLAKLIAIVVAGLTMLPTLLQSSVGQETATAIKGDLEYQVNLPGIFVADDKDEIKMEPSKYKGDLIITKILAEGVYVKKGEVLMEFDTDKVDESIEEAQNEATDANVELKKATAEFESAKIDLEANQAHLKVELTHLQREVEAAVAKQEMEQEKNEKGIVDAEESLANTLIDFETLKDIYSDRDIQNSASGNILFDREKKRIANSEKRIDVLKKELDYFKKFDKSKTQLDKELDVEKKSAEIKKEKVNLEAAVAEKEAVVIKAQRKMDTAAKKVAGLELDRSQLQVVSPRDGVVFYGQTGSEMPAGIIIFGASSGGIRKQLRIGGRVKTHKVLQTIAKMSNLSIKMSVNEDDIQYLKNDLTLTVYPDAFPSKHFAGKLTKVDQIATKIGFTSQQRRFKVMGRCTDDGSELRSGMNCRVAIHAESITDAILIPIASVFAKDGKYFCYVKNVSESNGSESTEREVEIGSSNPEFVQVISGIEVGDEVYLSRPAK